MFLINIIFLLLFSKCNKPNKTKVISPATNSVKLLLVYCSDSLILQISKVFLCVICVKTFFCSIKFFILFIFVFSFSFFLMDQFWKFAFCFLSVFSRISSCVMTVDMAMCLHTWPSPAMWLLGGLLFGACSIFGEFYFSFSTLLLGNRKDTEPSYHSLFVLTCISSFHYLSITCNAFIACYNYMLWYI